MAIDRELLVEIGYGQAGRATCNLVPAPELYASETNTECLTQDIEGAKALLEEAGWTDTDGDGVREKDGAKLSLLFQTSTNAVRQDFQALIKDWWSQIGVETELRNVDSSVFFGGDPGCPTPSRSSMRTPRCTPTTSTAPIRNPTCRRTAAATSRTRRASGRARTSTASATRNTMRLLDELAQTGELEERGEIARALNDIITKESITIIPLVDRGRVSAHSNTLGGVLLNTWDSELWNVADWYRID